MVSQVIDITKAFNESNTPTFEVGGWDFIQVQFVSPTGTVTFQGTDDAGAVQGETDGNATLATNFVTVGAYNIQTEVIATTANASSIFRFNYPTKFLRFSKTSVTATKVFLMYRKIC